MGKILEALVTDHLCIASSDYQGSIEYKKARDLYCRLGEQLLGKLNSEERKLLAEYSDAQEEEGLLYANDLFQKGFRLGVLMMMEVVTESDDFILHENNVK